jgi:hypothetical protein
VPPGVLSTIAESLSAELVPAADPLVCLLLNTGGEAELGAYCRRTPRPAARGPGCRLMSCAHSPPGPARTSSARALVVILLSPVPRLAVTRLPIAYSSAIDLDPSRLSHLGITNDHGQ